MARLPRSDRTRGSIGYGEDSHHSTEQLEQRARLPHFYANRYSVETAEGLNQEGRTPILYTEIPTAAQTSLLEWQRGQGYDQSPLQQSDEPTLVSVDARESIESARSRLPNGESRSRKRADSLVQQWHAEKEKLGKNDLDAREREELLYTLANICTTVMRDKRGVVGDVARAIGGSLVAPPIDPVHIQRFGAVDELVRIVTGGVPVHAAATGADLERALLYGNHLSVNENLPAVWKQLGEDVRRLKCGSVFLEVGD